MKNKIVLAIMLTLLFATFLAGIYITEAEGTTRVYVNPKFRTRVDPPGSSFSINIILEDVAGLYAWEFKLFWDKTILECVSEIVHIPPGVNWEDPNNYKLGPGIDNDNGLYHRGLVVFPLEEPYPVVFDGTTKLATLTFKVIAPGSCILDLEDTKLVHYDEGAIPHIAEDGYFESALPTISVDPRVTNAAPGSAFSVDILLEDVTDLIAWEFKLFWDNSILECVSEIVHIPPGVNWEDPNNYKFGTGIEQNYSTTEGRYGMYFKALVAIPVEEPHPVPFEGTTKLATLTFNVLAEGSCLLELRDTKFANSRNLVPIPHNARDGNFQLPHLAIKPSTTSTFTGTFSVDVTISNVDASVQLIGLDVKIRFDARIRAGAHAAIAATEGPFMKDPAWALNGTQFFGPYVDGDYVGFAILLMPHVDGGNASWIAFPEGSGTLATITFNATVGGSCALELFDAKLSDPDLGRIPSTTVDGSVTAMEGAASPDVNGDGIVDIYDIVAAIVAFGATPENPRWNPFIDINGDGEIDIYDIVLIAREFGKTV